MAIWHSSYPPGVPTEVDITQYPSVVALLEESFAKFRNDNAYYCMGRYLSYGELDQLSLQLGAYLQGLGLERGDRVAIMMPNLLQYPIAVAAVLRAGFVAVNVNPMYTARELEHQLNDSGSKAIVVLENFAATLQSVLPNTPVEHIVLASVGDMFGFFKGAFTNFAVRTLKKAVPAYSLPRTVGFKRALSIGKEGSFTRPNIKPDDVGVLQYTGGTTGVSKGATLLHSTLIASAMCSDAWSQPGFKRKPITGQVNVVCALPLYHVFAFISCALLGMRLGAMNILIPNPRDMTGSIKQLMGFKLHAFPAVNTLYQGLLNHPDFSKLDFTELVISNSGGMAVQEPIARKWLEVTGCPVAEGYGLSETSSGITCNRTDTDKYTGTIGIPLPNVDVRIIDDDEIEVPVGERGEIAIRGPQVMDGYWQRPEETAKNMTADGYFKSGDIGIMEENGYLRIVDRKKDMILVSGFNVYPNEIEGVIVGLEGVLECAVIGVPDAKAGESVMAFVVKKDQALTEKDVANYCTEHLTGYKKPRKIRFVDELPKSNVGKILRRELRTQTLAEMEQKEIS